MKKNEFDLKYLNKWVVVVLHDNIAFIGRLFSTNDYMKLTKSVDVKNYYFVAPDIRFNGLRFRKSHIKKITLLDRALL